MRKVGFDTLHRSMATDWLANARYPTQSGHQFPTSVLRLRNHGHLLIQWVKRWANRTTFCSKQQGRTIINRWMPEYRVTWFPFLILKPTNVLEGLYYINAYGSEIHPSPNPDYLYNIGLKDVLVYSCGSLWTRYVSSLDSCSLIQTFTHLGHNSIIPCLALRGVAGAIARSRSLRAKILLCKSPICLSRCWRFPNFPSFFSEFPEW